MLCVVVAAWWYLMIFSFDILNAEKINSIEKLNAINLYTLAKQTLNKKNLKNRYDKKDIKLFEYKWKQRTTTKIEIFLDLKIWFPAGIERSSKDLFRNSSRMLWRLPEEQEIALIFFFNLLNQRWFMHWKIYLCILEIFWKSLYDS